MVREKARGSEEGYDFSCPTAVGVTLLWPVHGEFVLMQQLVFGISRGNVSANGRPGGVRTVMTWTNRISRSRMPDFNSGQNPLDFNANLEFAKDSTTYFLHRDHLGSTRLVTGLGTQVVDNLDYLPFGEQIAGDTGTTHKFTGKERDSESSLDNVGFRNYASTMGDG